MTALETAYAEVQRLVQRFKAISAAERRGMNENATRQGYILPLFRTLGWNVDNTNEVSPEEKVSRGWVDFSFRIGGIPRFFLETKKASEDLNDPRWVQQAIDYAWTKSVTWALLSDFEGLRVFNAEWKETDPFRAQFLEFNLESYLTDFERLWWFSREETLAGRLDREADKVSKRIKRLPVSQHLFDDLKQWRSELYQSLRGYNPLYSPAQIDEAVLRLLNRLIFIRTAEDRDVEPMRLMPLLRELEDQRQLDKLSVKLAELFRQFDATYNSELFAPHFSEELYCDRPPLESLINGLYEKNFVRYNFNALEADVLGTAYEQYLGHVVTEVQSETGMVAAASHVDEKRAKRKSQGIYYTPAFVTRYIVQQTVSRWLDEHGYNPSTPPRILDMACGSGSFLIEAFDTLDRFVANMRHQSALSLPPPNPQSKVKMARKASCADLGEVSRRDGGGGADELHDNLRCLELLQSCIFGVDKDKQAVDVARLNLMLRALHGRQKLPLLTNIGEGDSLISGTPEELQAAFGENWQAKKPFDWEKEFPEVMKAGGFDVIIGNPPYGMLQPHNTDEKLLSYLNGKYQVASFKIDIFHLFIERCLMFLRNGGYLGLIVPNTFITNVYTQKLRKLITSNCVILQLIVSSERMFEEAEVNNAIVILQKEENPDKRLSSSISIVLDADEAFLQHQESLARTHHIRQQDLIFLGSGSWNIKLSDELVHMLRRLQAQSEQLQNIAKVNRGLISGNRDKYFSKTPKSEKWLPIITGTDINRYCIEGAKEYIHFEKPKGAGGSWDPQVHRSNKIVIRQIGYYPIAAYDIHPYCVTGNIFTVRSITAYKHEYLLGILNSRFTQWLWQLLYGDFKAIFPELKGIYLEQFPIRRIDFADPAEKSAHDEIVKMVEEMLGLQKQRQRAEAAKEDVRFSLQKRIEALDREIDVRVYRLYGLTEEEVKIVEGG